MILGLIAVAVWFLFFQTTGSAIPIIPSLPTLQNNEPTRQSRNMAQLLATPYDFSDEPASREAMRTFIQSAKPGVVVAFGSNISAQQVRSELLPVLDAISKPERPLLAVDHEGGQVQRMKGAGFTLLPSWRDVCQLNQADRQEILTQSAAELQKVGVQIVFAPVVDVAQNNQVAGNRICSGDPDIVSTTALEFIEVFERHQIMSVLKHYPGIGSAKVDTHFRPASVTLSDKDLQPFTQILEKHPRLGVMSSHVSRGGQDEDKSCSLSPTCLSGLIEQHPEAIIFTDAIEMGAARYNPAEPEIPKPLEAVAVEAILAGNTVVLLGRDSTPTEIERIIQRFEREYASSEVFRERADQALEKIGTLR